jgi:hypothetical protein
MMHLFKLLWLITKFIFFWHFIYLHYTNYLEQDSYYIKRSLGTSLDFTRVYHYMNALNVFSKLLIGFILIFLISLILKFQVFIFLFHFFDDISSIKKREASLQ